MDGKIIQMVQYQNRVLFLTDKGTVYEGWEDAPTGHWQFEEIIRS